MPAPLPPDDADHAASDDPNPWQELEDRYADPPPWEIGRPQKALLDVARSGAVQGRVLDVGCGTGEHAFMCADLGLDVTGIDLATTALRTAEDKARQRGSTVRFLRHNALELPALGERYDTVLDSGMFHMLDPQDRATFTSGLRTVLRPGGRYFLLCFSDREPRTPGVTVPYRLSRDDITEAFGDKLQIDSVVPATIEITLDPAGIRGWLCAMTNPST